MLLRSLGTYIIHIKQFQREKTPDEALPDGYVPFLRVQRKDKQCPCTVLRVWFEVRRLSFWQRKALPVLSIPFYAGMPGFVSKVYGINKPRKQFMGLYEWQSAADAERYIKSSAGRFMRMNAVSMRYEIFNKETEI